MIAKNVNKTLQNNSLEIRKRLYNFLKSHEVKGTGLYHTHTAFGDPWGKFNIPDEKMDEFIELYCDALGKIDLHMTERPKNVGPFLIDIDFHFDANHSERQYKEDDIKYVVGNANSIIRKYYKWTPKNLISFVSEKDKPSIRERKDTNVKEYKDGFHIMYPYLPISQNMRYYILEEIKKQISNNKGFRHIPYINDLDDIFDISIVSRNGWMMYGSRKANGQQYYLKHVYTCTFDDDELENYKHKDLVKILSNRIYNDQDELHFKDNINKNELTNNINQVLIKHKIIKDTNKNNNNKDSKNNNIEFEDNDNTDDDQDDDANIFDEEKESIKAEILQRIKEENKKKAKSSKNKDINLAKKLVPLLSQQRATGYWDWIKVGWALKSVSQNLLPLFKDFSKKCPGKYDPKECEKVWDNARDEGLTIGSLRHWAKLDNSEKYSEIMRDSINELLAEAESGTEYDIAIVVYELYKESYKCTSINHSTWYEFQEHRWVAVDHGYTLNKKISAELTKEFAILNAYYYRQMATLDGYEKDIMFKRANSITKIIIKLKQSGFKKNILSECMNLFYDPLFDEKLDSNRNLIGFNNGVFDLESMTFRAGNPEDNLSMTVGYDYEPYSYNHEYIKGIEDYFSKIQREDDMKEYILTLMASYLDGHTGKEQFVLWTGSGCHAAGTPIMMYDGSVKMVENIRLGDKLMGNDSTPRKVKHRYEGQDDMYKIIPSKGDPYIVNKEHRLALKFIGCNYINWDKKYNNWVNKWIEFDDNNGFQTKSKSFHFSKSNILNNDFKNESYQKAKTFSRLNELTNENFVPKGHILSIKVKDFLRIDAEIRRLFLGFKCSVEFQEKELKLDPYMLGYWLGNGWTNDKNITTTHPEIIKYFGNELEKYNYGISNKNKYSESGSNHFRNILKELNLFNNKHIPKHYLCNSRENRMKLLAGILDSDGYYTKGSNNFEICQKSEKLLDDIIFLARSLGFAAYKYEVCTNAPVGPKTKKYYKTNIYGNGINEIPTLIKRTFPLDKNSQRDCMATSIKIHHVNKDNYYGFELDGNQSYLLGDFTRTFNSNGKSKTVELFQLAFGDYCGVLPITVLTRKRAGSSQATPELAEMRGKRFVVFQEPENDDVIQVGFMKELTGGDWIYARPLFKDPIRYKPQFKLLLTCNKLPTIPSTDGGTWRRLRVSPWESEFVDEPKLPNQFKKDYELLNKLELWKKAFIWYLIHKWYPIYKKNNLKEPEKVKQFTKKFKKQSDILLEFMEENLIKTDSVKNKLRHDVLYSAFKSWFGESCSGKCPINKKDLQEYISNNSQEYKSDKSYLFYYKFRNDDDDAEGNNLDE